MADDITPKAPDSGNPPQPEVKPDDLGKPVLARKVEATPAKETPAAPAARTTDEQAAYDKLDDAGKKADDEARAANAAPAAIKPPEMTAEEKVAYDKMTDPDKKRFDDERQKKAEEAAAKKEAKPEGAPEKYEAFKLPEGVVLDETHVTAFTDIAKKNNLSQAAAQEMLDLAIKKSKDDAVAFDESWKKARLAWRNEIKSDKEIGGAKLQETYEYCQRALDKFGSPRLREEVLETGFGDHPELVRLLDKVGRALGEDKIIEGKSTPAAQSLAEVMYPNQAKKQ